MMLSGNIVLDDNPITRYCLRNVELRTDFNGNVKPLKNVEKKKIDGVIAMLHSEAAYLQHNKEYHGTQIF
jgi:phage terminase large subunit-like protein